MPLGKKITAENFDDITESVRDYITAPRKRRKRTAPKASKRSRKTKTAASSHRKRVRKSKSGHKSKHGIRRRPAGNTKRTKKRVGKTYYTKKGQPYKILRDGRARFIKGKRNMRK